MPKKSESCGVSRRGFLKVGAVGLPGMGLADLLRLRGQTAVALTPAKSVILVCLPGGPSHLDMYDMKPNAAAEFRGEFEQIHTNVPGLDICEHMPLQATIADKLAVVRNLKFTQPDHQMHEVFTGFPAGPNAPFLSPPMRPAFGSVVSKLRSSRSLLPKYISMGLSDHYTVANSEVPLYLGPVHAPFEPTGEDLGNLELKAGMGLDRLGDRQAVEYDPVGVDAGTTTFPPRY